MSYTREAARLRENIQVITSTFESNNLRVLNIGCKPYNDDDADVSVYVEISTISGPSIPCDLEIKINLYDSNGILYMTKSEYLPEDEFNGYDTVEIECYDSSHTLERAVSGRLFVTRAY